MTSRRSLDQTRDLLLLTGAEMLACEGISVTLDDLKMIDVCRAAGLKTAGSAYKIWPTQEDFRADLFKHLIEASTASFATIEGAGAELASADGRPLLRDLVRTQTAANAELNRTTYPTYVALWLAAQSDSTLSELFEASDAEWLEALGTFFTGVLEIFDLELIPPYTSELFATAVSALVEGFTVRSRATPELVPASLPRPTGPGGQVQDWTLYGCAVEALFEAFTRPRSRDVSVPDDTGV